MIENLKIPVYGKAWRQVDGGVNPGTYGGTIAHCDGDRIELLEIQPTRTYVGDSDAAEVGFPFWTREACYNLADLQNAPQGALQCVGLDDPEYAQRFAELSPEQRAVALACAMLNYGHGIDEGPCGFARDILGERRVYWFQHKRATGWRYLADEDRDFRRMLRDQ